MSLVQSYLKEPCPCGDARCRAFGAVNPKTGHARKCWDGCPKCASAPRAGQTKRHKVPDAIRREVRARSGGKCEVTGCEFDADHMHHKRRRSQGGRDSASNLIDVCWEHHEMIHANVAWAVENGYLIHNEPESSAVVRVEKVERS